MSSIDLDTIIDSLNYEDLEKHIRSACYYYDKSLIIKDEHRFNDIISFNDFIVKEIVNSAKGKCSFNLFDFSWSNIPTVVFKDYLVNFDTNTIGYLLLKMYILNLNKESIVNGLCANTEFNYKIKGYYYIDTPIFEIAERHSINDRLSFDLYIKEIVEKEFAEYKLFTNKFCIVSPKMKQELIDELPRFIECHITPNYLFKQPFSIDDEEEPFDEPFKIRVKIIDNENGTITIKCTDKDIYSYALLALRYKIQRKIFIEKFDDNDNIYLIHLYEDWDELELFKWLKDNSFNLEFEYSNNGIRQKISGIIKSINNKKVIERIINEIDGQGTSNNSIYYNDDDIVLELI